MVDSWNIRISTQKDCGARSLKAGFWFERWSDTCCLERWNDSYVEKRIETLQAGTNTSGRTLIRSYLINFTRTMFGRRIASREVRCCTCCRIDWGDRGDRQYFSCREVRSRRVKHATNSRSSERDWSIECCSAISVVVHSLVQDLKVEEDGITCVPSVTRVARKSSLLIWGRLLKLDCWRLTWKQIPQTRALQLCLLSRMTILLWRD